MKSRLNLILSFLLGAGLLHATGGESVQQKVRFNDDWRFHKGEAPGAEVPAFADKGWRTVRLPEDWAIDGPVLYTAVTTLSRAGGVIDTYRTDFGIRTIRYTAAEGFFLNDRLVRFNGVCMHHDLGALGAGDHPQSSRRERSDYSPGGIRRAGCGRDHPDRDTLSAGWRRLDWVMRI